MDMNFKYRNLKTNASQVAKRQSLANALTRRVVKSRYANALPNSASIRAQAFSDCSLL